MRSACTSTLKHTLDFLASLLLAGLLAPLSALIALSIKLNSPGPVLFRQERLGLWGKPFWIYKFRTMIAEGDNNGITTLADHRVTSLGRLLRRRGLDEIPQLLNILRGEMSFVGPRPLLEAMIKPEERSRLVMKPGITGPVVVNGDNALSRDERMAVDDWYVKNWGLGLDLAILFGTIRVLFTRQDVCDSERVL